MIPSLARRRVLQAPLAALVLPMVVSGCGQRAPAPDFSYTLLDGSRHHSASLRGRVLLVNFWATSCSVCVQEMPHLVALHQRNRARGFDTLAVAMSYDPPALVADYAESRRLPFGVVIDNTGVIARAHGDIKVTPTSLLVDRRGTIVDRYVGAPDFAALQGRIDRLLAET